MLKRRRVNIGLLIAGIVIAFLGIAGWGCSKTLLDEDSDLLTEGSVQQSWVQRYRGDYSGEGDYSGARSVAVGDDGCIYVTGKDATEGTGNYSYGSDYVTVKYDTRGHRVWVARYDGTNDDEAIAIALDQLGNAYVTGASGNECITIKYDASGEQLWTARQNGASPVAILLDSSGNPHIAAASGGDYLTIKYDSDGNQIWMARYDGEAGSDQPKDMVVDDAGNVYVTGESECTVNDDNTDYATVKYDSSGNEVWVQRYSGSGDHRYTAYELAVDESGNVYVSGHKGERNDWGYATVKYDSAGNQLWVALYQGKGSVAGMAIDDEGNVCVIGSGEYAYDASTTLKYDPSGRLLWAATAPYETCKASAMTMDDEGNVYVAGENCSVIKYDPDGNEVWSVYYDETPQIGYLRDIALDTSGNVYVVGNWDMGARITVGGGDPVHRDQYTYYTAKYTQGE